MIKAIQTEMGFVEFRIVGKGPTILVLNGGHTNCNSPFEHEDFFISRGYSLLIPSRPGYGKTPKKSGKTAEGFSRTLAALLDELAIDNTICVGISASGRTALHFAKDYPDKVSKLILECAITCEKWPDFGTRIAALIAFNSFMEKFTWAMMRKLRHSAPKAVLSLMLPSLSTLRKQDVINAWDGSERMAVLDFLVGSRSGSGFLLDIKHKFNEGDLESIAVPTLIITSKYDKSVSPENSIKAAKYIKNAELMMVEAESHLIWFSNYKADIESKIDEFLNVSNSFPQKYE
jgi:pimeloyl-ACP methyl ester carboxylesterase